MNLKYVNLKLKHKSNIVNPEGDFFLIKSEEELDHYIESFAMGNSINSLIYNEGEVKELAYLKKSSVVNTIADIINEKLFSFRKMLKDGKIVLIRMSGTYCYTNEKDLKNLYELTEI